jgi:hypothetical protein
MPVVRCPACATEHRVSVVQADYQEMPCRDCGRSIELGAGQPHATATDNGGESCPSCGGEIRAKAIKCRHCKQFVDGRGQRRRGAAWTLAALTAAALLSFALWWIGSDRTLELMP